MKQLQINIIGKCATGKSTVMLLLEEFLLEKGFAVEIGLEMELRDHKTEDIFRNIMNYNKTERIEALANSVEIKITQEHCISKTPHDK